MMATKMKYYREQEVASFLQHFILFYIIAALVY